MKGTDQRPVKPALRFYIFSLPLIYALNCAGVLLEIKPAALGLYNGEL